ncbi:MAG: hypothetical protein WBK51_08285 [Polaromonas sp.]
MNIPPSSPKRAVQQRAVKQEVHSPITIVESKVFEQDADAVFSDIERRALYLALAENPLIGEPVKKAPALRRVIFCGYGVVYSVAQNLKALHLLLLEDPKDTSSVDDKDWKKVNVLISYLIKGGVIGGAKKFIEWLIELLN